LNGVWPSNCCLDPNDPNNAFALLRAEMAAAGIPPMTLIPGFKIKALYDPAVYCSFDDPNTWAEATQLAQRLMDCAADPNDPYAPRRFLIDDETTTENYYRSPDDNTPAICSWDPNAFAAGLDYLADPNFDVDEIIWYVGLDNYYSWKTDRYAWSLEKCTIVQDVLDSRCRIVDGTYGQPVKMNDDCCTIPRAALASLGAANAQLIWFNDDPNDYSLTYWNHHNARHLLDMLDGKDYVYFYPGYAGWDIEAESIVPHVQGHRGDMNCDGYVDWRDIDPYLVALNDGESAYIAAYPSCRYWAADCNCDLVVDSNDTDPFIAIMNGGTPCGQ